jgi:predicted CoA-binding protein
MPQADYSDLIPRMLSRCHTIAVVGMSADPKRDSYHVSQYMQGHGYRIVPVNPTYAGTTILGEHCFPTLQAAADQLTSDGQRIDMVNCFRRSDAMVLVAEEAIEIGALCLWMQLGVVNQKAADLAQAAGIAVVMDRCIKIEHSDL